MEWQNGCVALKEKYLIFETLLAPGKRDTSPCLLYGFKAPYQGDLKPNPLSFLAEHFSQAVFV